MALNGVVEPFVRCWCAWWCNLDHKGGLYFHILGTLYRTFVRVYIKVYLPEIFTTYLPNKNQNIRLLSFPFQISPKFPQIPPIPHRNPYRANLLNIPFNPNKLVLKIPIYPQTLPKQTYFKHTIKSLKPLLSLHLAHITIHKTHLKFDTYL
jgi:hypothetical protein